MREPTVYDTTDECKSPVSTCCGWPPIENLDLCSRCKEHSDWYDEEDPV